MAAIISLSDAVRRPPKQKPKGAGCGGATILMFTGVRREPAGGRTLNG